MSIALWCVLAAAFLPLAASLTAKLTNLKSYDNNNPREWLSRQTGLAARANAAQLNAFEAFPLFAAAVIIATMRQVPQDRLDLLAEIFIAARLGYLGCYLADKAVLRSLVWAVAFFCCIAMFVSAA